MGDNVSYDAEVLRLFSGMLDTSKTYLENNPETVSMLLATGFREDLRLKVDQERAGSTKLVYEYNPLEGASFTDSENDYILNSRGARSVEFFVEPDLLIAGCSQTYGVGVTEDATWGAVLAGQLDVDYVNIAHQGASVFSIVSNILAYIREFGKPKTIAVLLPDLYRLTAVSAKGITTKHGDEVRKFVVEDVNIDGSMKNSSKPKFSKREHLWEDVVPKELPLYLSMTQLHILVQYCRDAGIKLVWGTWVPELDKFFTALQGSSHNVGGLYDDFVSLYSKNAFGFYEDDDCHLAIKAKYPRFFDEGVDRTAGRNGHMGAHKHAHIADDFYSWLVR